MEEMIKDVSLEKENSTLGEKEKEIKTVTLEEAEALTYDSFEEEEQKPKKKRQIALKIIATLLYLAITIAAVIFETTFVWETISLLSKPELGLEGIAFIIIIPILIIIPIAAFVLYLIPFIMSVIGFGVSFKKTKKGAKRCGKIYFPALAFITALSEFALVFATVASLLAIKFQ